MFRQIVMHNLQMSSLIKKIFFITLMITASTPGAFSRAAPVVLVEAVSTVPNAAERHYARRVTGRLQGWLQNHGIATLVINDQTAAQAIPEATRLVILPYNPQPSKEKLRNLRNFINRGGKLLVFYSADRELAEMMGFRLGDYHGDTAGRKWTRVVFIKDTGLENLPGSYRQTSRSMRPVFPQRPDARIIAWWHDIEDERNAPAWAVSDSGGWMTHVMLDDADSMAKAQTVLAFAGQADPSIWERAAQQAGRNARLPHQPDYRNSRNALSEHPAINPQILAALDQQHTRARALLASAKHAQAFSAFHDLRIMLKYAYARIQVPQPGEIAAVWDHFGTGLYPGDWPRTAQQLAANGITDVFVNVLWPGQAHYESSVVPPSSTYREWGDQLQQALAACGKHNIKLHAWKVCWNLEGADAALIESLARQNRLQLDKNGNTVNWLCPSHTDNLRMEKDAIRELLRKYAVDGVHLDYIRFPDPHSCYCPRCRAGFEKHEGRKITNWPAPVLEWPLRGRFLRWRAHLITRLVEDVYAIKNNTRPEAVLSVAVFGRYPTCVESVAQDWVDWNRRGIVDLISPMNYTTDLAVFRQWSAEQLGFLSSSARLLPGIGATAAESRLDAVQVIDQINAARSINARGFILFDLNHTLGDEILPLLRQGILRDQTP